MRTRAMIVTTAVAGLATLAVTACDPGVRLEARTFPLETLQPHEATGLVDPYVYGEREGNPGSLSAIGGAITVRETPENLERIARVLEEFDQPRPDLRLHFQVIEADGFDDRDAAIAEVVTELEKIFRFQGYRLMGEAVVTAADGGWFQQALMGTAESWRIEGTLFRLSGQGMRLDGIQLIRAVDGGEIQLQTSATVRVGQTLVLGSTPRSEGSRAGVILTVRVEETGGEE